MTGHSAELVPPLRSQTVPPGPIPSPRRTVTGPPSFYGLPSPLLALFTMEMSRQDRRGEEEARRGQCPESCRLGVFGESNVAVNMRLKYSTGTFDIAYRKSADREVAL